MKTITITVKEKIATAEEDAFIVCGNSDIKASFVFDDEWDGAGTKTAVFVTSDGAAYYVEIADNCCQVPVLYGTAYVKIGVISASVFTSTAATVVCKAAVTDEAEADGSIDGNRYEALCEMIDNRFPKGGTAGEILIKQSSDDYDAAWGTSDTYCKTGDVFTKKEQLTLLQSKAPKRNLVTDTAEVIVMSDLEDYLLSDVSKVSFMCENPLATECNIMLTTAAQGEISVSFEGLIAYSGPDPEQAGNGETWEFDVLRGRCIGRKWA
ncbi:MAG: hypothetical protein E7597_06825 [Ruminococcaceae bacterium]|nr:hypothetical protein [Oscillospiraceae bacterium]